MVNKETGAITAPVSAELFKTANDLDGGGAAEAHAATHAAAGDDPVTLAQSQITGLTAALAAKAAASDLTSHTGNTSNPHSVTKAQVGLANADNTSDAAKPVSTATQTALDAKAAAADLTSHTGNTSNPHSVTKTQVGLGNADNTSDASKPISALTQAALDGKQPLATVLTNTTAAFTTAQETKLAGVETGAQANVALASQAEAEAGVETTKTMTPVRVAQAIAALTSPGGVSSVDGATGAVVTGYDDRITALENVEPTASGSNLVSGGGASLTGGLTLTVSAALYNILGAAKSSVETILTAATADPTNPRYDVVALDDTGTAVLITGTPAATPVVPTVDPATQLYLTFVSIPAGATSISGTETIIYDSNDDYTMTENGTSIVLNSSNNPRGGSGVCIEATTMVAGDYFQAQTASGTIDLGTFNVLRFFIRNKAAWHASKQITITARNNGVQVGQAVVFKHGLHAFDQTNVTTYQHIALNPNLFAAGGQPINQLRWTCAGGGSSITGFYVDDISLQAGVSQVTDSTRLRDTGEHSTARQYDVNDLAYTGAVIYKALQQTPVGIVQTNTTYWTPFAMRNPMTTAGDSIVGGASGVPTRLALGTSLQELRVSFAGTAQEWGPPNLKHFPFSFNPKAVCDGTIDRLFLMTVGPEFPNGLKITRWNVSFDADPTTEADLDFKRADAFIGVANAAVVDVLDTTAGVSSETTAANINSDTAVANGKVLYLEFGTAYTADNLQIIFEFWGYAV